MNENSMNPIKVDPIWYSLTDGQKFQLWAWASSALFYGEQKSYGEHCTQLAHLIDSMGLSSMFDV